MIYTINDNTENLEKGGPYIGPRGGKWADPKHTIPWAEKTTKKNKAEKEESSMGSRDNPLPSLPKDTAIRDMFGVSFSKWGGNLALVRTSDDRDYAYGNYKENANIFNPENMSTKYLVRYALDDSTKKPIRAKDGLIGKEPTLSNPNLPYEQNRFRVGEYSYGGPSEGGFFGPNKEIWVRRKISELGKNQSSLVESYLRREKEYREADSNYGSVKMNAAKWKKALSMTYSDIQASDDSDMANVAEKFLAKQRVDIYDSSESELNKVWADIPGLLLLDKKGRLKAVIERPKKKDKVVKKSQFVIDLEKGGPYIGPRGGKYADSAHKIPYKEKTTKKNSEIAMDDPRRFLIGTSFIQKNSKGKREDVETIIDIHTTVNSAGGVVKTSYVAKRTFMGQEIVNYDIPKATIARAKIINLGEINE